MSIVETDFYSHGYRCIVRVGSLGYRLGYVGVSSSHPLYQHEYNMGTSVLSEMGEVSPDMYIRVHGGLTYAGEMNDIPNSEEELWYFGYDCAHAGDAPDPQYSRAMDRYAYNDTDIVRSNGYCRDQCELLARQLRQIEVEYKAVTELCEKYNYIIWERV